MSDVSIAARLERRVGEERGLRQCEAADSADVLRQRRALHDAGGDPDDAHARDADTVERYLQ